MSFFILTFLAALGESGLLKQLANGPATFSAIAEFCGARDQGREALEAWLQMGVRLHLLTLGSSGYSLRGLSRKISKPGIVAALAMAQEVAVLHYKLIAGS